jgi:hypothetical protein
MGLTKLDWNSSTFYAFCDDRLRLGCGWGQNLIVALTEFDVASAIALSVFALHPGWRAIQNVLSQFQHNKQMET